jgi:hypothetical protein
MKAQRAIVALVVLNLLLLTVQIAHARSARSEPVVDVLRAHALELVDDEGRVRAELRVLPAQADVRMPDGTKGYPEAVQLRLISSTGSPHVKLVASEDGSGMVLGGERGAYVQVMSRGGEPYVKVRAAAGQEKLVRP